jgi:hypothetical protein
MSELLSGGPRLQLEQAASKKQECHNLTRMNVTVCALQQVVGILVHFKKPSFLEVSVTEEKP